MSRDEMDQTHEEEAEERSAVTLARRFAPWIAGRRTRTIDADWNTGTRALTGVSDVSKSHHGLGGRSVSVRAMRAEDALKYKHFYYACCHCGVEASVRDDSFWCDDCHCYIPVEIIEILSLWRRLVQEDGVTEAL